MKKIIALTFLSAYILAACSIDETKELKFNTLPEELSGCKFFELKISSQEKVIVTKCPNVSSGSVSSSINRGGASITGVTVEGALTKITGSAIESVPIIGTSNVNSVEFGNVQAAISNSNKKEIKANLTLCGPIDKSMSLWLEVDGIQKNLKVIQEDKTAKKVAIFCPRQEKPATISFIINN